MSSSVASIAEWQKRVAALVPSLSPAHARVLGLISFGIIVSNSCGLTCVSHELAKLEHVNADSMRQRIREFYYEASAKRGQHRQAVEVQACFRDLLAGIVRDWQGEKVLALALDASTLDERFTVLNLSVLYRGCGIPVAWTIVPANQKGSWRPHWESLLQQVAGVVPQDWLVVVMTDRGLYASWLFTAIQQLGWHPLMRANATMGFRAEGESDFVPIGSLLRRRGRSWKGQGEWSEEGDRMQGTLLIEWEKGYDEPVATVTDLGKETVEGCWYFQRFGIEGEYKDHKSGGWGWQQTKMEDPQRAGRVWLAMAVAMQIAVMVGGLEEAQEQEEQARKKKQAKQPRRVGRPVKPLWRPRGREQSCLMRGQQSIRAAVIRREPLPEGYGVSEPWPTRTYRRKGSTSSWRKKCQQKEAARKKEQRRRERATQQEPCQRRPPEPPASRARVVLHEASQNPRKLEAAADPPDFPKHRRLPPEERERRRQQRIRQRELRQEEQVRKREERMRAREEDAQFRAQRHRWHEEIQREREACTLRRAERAACPAAQTLGSSSVASKIFQAQQALTEPPKPPETNTYP